MKLDGLWKFKIDKGTAQTEQWEKHFPKDAEELYVPASYNDQREDPVYRNHTGEAYYERTCVIPNLFKGQRLFLRFDAVAHDSTVWLNGEKLMTHRGGFLPFEAEITDLVKPGEEIRLTVSCNNRVDHHTLPMGNEEGTAFFGSDNAQVPAVQKAKEHRGVVNLPNFDFFNYAGINRHVFIYTTPSDYIKDVTIVSDVDGNDGVVNYSVEVSKLTGCEKAAVTVESSFEEGRISSTETNSGSVNEVAKECPVHVEVLDRDGEVIAEAAGASGTIRIPDAHLWNPWPEDPYLYKLRVRFGEDEYTEDFGIRTVKVEGTKFLINGKPFYFKGFGKHEDFYVSGRGINEGLNVKDVSLLHWIGANSFRTSHYPYAEEMYRLCDREGIVIIDETPAVGIAGGGVVDPYTFPIKDYHKSILRDLVARDKNHPSVVMWSLGNEPDTENFPESAYKYWHELYEYTHELDPQNRPVTLVCCQNDYTRDITTRTMDVVCINRYYGWYNLCGDMDSAIYAWNLELDFWAEQGKPVMVTEYGCDTLPGLHGTVAEMWTEEFQAEYYRRIDAEFDKRDFFIGEQCWAFADFGTIQGVYRADGNRKGVFTKERRPKMAAHFLRSRWEKLPNFGYKAK